MRSHLALIALSALLSSGILFVSPEAPAPTAPSSPAEAATLEESAAAAHFHAGLDEDPFLTSFNCSHCHSASNRSKALRTADGEDVSPYETWIGTMMANSFHDPFWHAQMALEQAGTPEGGGDPTTLCVRCHSPIAHHDHVMKGLPEPGIEAAKDHDLGDEGVSCTVCHQISPEGLGSPEQFDGRIVISKTRQIFGPYANPRGGPMTAQTDYIPTQGLHIQESELCAGCHTLRTQHTPNSPLFQEQTPYLEWKNSIFAREGEESRTCQECHMPDMGTMRIARNPVGGDFRIQKRDHVRTHTFLGANAFMLGMLADHAETLDIDDRVDALRKGADLTRQQLAKDSARIAIENLRREDGRVRFEVRVQNLTGHKLPTGYPARRVGLTLKIEGGDQVLFQSGALTDAGRLEGKLDPHALPHRKVVTAADQPVIYETVALDSAGEPTTSLIAMVARRKDNRILPRGWLPDGPEAQHTKAFAIDGDEDFIGGEDRVAFDLALEGHEALALTVSATLWIQTVPPSWVDPFRKLQDPAAQRFVNWYDAKPDRGTPMATDSANLPKR